MLGITDSMGKGWLLFFSDSILIGTVLLLKYKLISHLRNFLNIFKQLCNNTTASKTVKDKMSDVSDQNETEIL